MELIKRRVNGLNRLVKWPLLCGLLGMVLVPAAPATDAFYINDSVLNYTIPPDKLNQIDASNFVNNSSLTINFANATINTELLEPMNTVNYTNSKTGTLSANTGFRFDTQTTNVISRQMAGNFYNKGVINCASINGTNIVLLVGLGQCIVWATNIVNPGTIDVGQDGLMQFTGSKVDLTRSVLIIEGAPIQTGSGGVFATNNTANWTPAGNLTPNFAFSSPTVNLSLNNSTSFFDIRTNLQNGTNIIIRAVFVQSNVGPNVAYSVFIDQNVNPGDTFGAGAADIQWTGTYVDPISGLVSTNYLVLNDDYVLGSKTNCLPLVSGIPQNFTLTTSATPLIFGTPPTPAGFPPGFAFNAGAVSNTYAYATINFPSTDVPTNSPSQDVSNYLAILPGRVEINASQELNMGLAEISGPNYVSIKSPNHFAGSAGAQIFSPYTDVNLGVTNGFLTVSNLLEPFTVFWNGTVQAWSARWLLVSTNGATNDFRVLLVGSQLGPTSPSLVQNMTLHSTNSLIIGDNLNIIGTMSEDAPNLTITTNASNPVVPAGALNIQSSALFWSGMNPNLRNLTNNGFIGLQNLAVFGGAPPANYHSLINGGQISAQGVLVRADNFVNSGIFSSGAQSFALLSATATLTNGSITAGGNISLATGSLLASNAQLKAGAALTIAATNVLTDTGVTNGNIWSVYDGINLAIKPLTGALLGTTITNTALDNQDPVSTWAGLDLGYSTAGFVNNAAVGRFILDVAVTNLAHTPPHTELSFSGVGASNAMYVDYLELRGYATNRLGNNVPALDFDPANPSLVIYYAQAVANGLTVAEKINGGNGGHLRWLPAYAGYYSSTNLVYTNVFNGMTNITVNAVNAALAQSSTYDSDGDGIPNQQDPTPVYVAGEMFFRLTVTNVPPLTAGISWQTIPGATNSVFYRTNLVAGSWVPLTNFVSPMPYPSPLTTVTVSDPVGPGTKFYQVRVVPSAAPPYGPGP